MTLLGGALPEDDEAGWPGGISTLRLKYVNVDP